MSCYVDRLVLTDTYRKAIKAAFADGLTMLQMHSAMGITYNQCQTMVLKMRRAGELPPAKKRSPPNIQKIAARKARNGHGASSQKQGFYKWTGGRATPPLDGPLIDKIGSEPPGPNAKPFLECNGCMWPVADNLYCGEPKNGGRQPYCAKHHSTGVMSYQPSKKVVENRGYALLKSLNQ